MIITDENISAKAKGVYFIVKHLEESNVYITIESVMALVKDGERLVRSAINELIENNYISRETIRQNGRIFKIEYKTLK